jgi:acyl-CoA synthetase (AMP-forming)/AMP-acid ligase II
MTSMGLWVAPLDPTVSFSSLSEVDARVKGKNLCAVLSDRSSPFVTDIPWLWLDDIESWAHESRSSSVTSRVEGGIVLASSGTTGTPKIIQISTYQLLVAARLVSSHNQLTPADRGFNPLPLWHINAIVVGLLSTLVAGSSLALDDRFHRTEFWSKLERLGVTWVNAVPAIIARLSNMDETEQVPIRIRFIRSASAPLAPAQLERFERITNIPVIESYGMTEATSQICANPLVGPRKIGSVGRPVGVEVRISTGYHAEPTVVPSCVRGEVVIRGPSVIDQYAAPGYEDRFDLDGWLRTGDVGYFDDDGFLFLVGRKDDVINRGGEKIFPRELEESALSVDGVVGAAVIARDHEVYGQVPELFVQLLEVTSTTINDQMSVVLKELEDEMARSFTRTRRPVSIVVVESFPVGATGKIKKKDLCSGEVTVLARHVIS